MLLVKTGSERAKDSILEIEGSILEVEVTALSLIGYIVALKLLKADYKVNRLIA